MSDLMRRVYVVLAGHHANKHFS